MKSVWMNEAHHSRVLVFFAGWGMDERPFVGLEAGEWDVVVHYDYRDSLEVPMLESIEAHPEMAVVAWSLGCAVGNAVCLRRGWKPLQAVAINGTLVPEDEEVGIPRRWMAATAGSLLKGGWEKFVARMCPDAASRAAFDAHRPNRDLAGALEELEKLRRLAVPAGCVFDRAIVADRDRIILPENQGRCWERHDVPVTSVAGGHYPFHQWTSWEEVLACGG